MTRLKKFKTLILQKIFGFWLNILYFFDADKSARISYSLIISPRKGKLDLANLPDFLKKAKHKTLDYSTISFKTLSHKTYHIQTYQWYGTGLKILFIHGWESNSNRWSNIVEYLSEYNYNFISLDAPTSGLSKGGKLTPMLYASFIDVVIEHFQPEIIVSHSLGAFSSLYQLSKKSYPNLKKVVLLGCPNNYERIMTNYKGLLSISNSNYNWFARQADFFIGSPLKDYKSEFFISKINLDTLIIHDENDQSIPISDGEAIHKSKPSAKFIKTKGFGHSLQDPSVYQNIQDFISNT